MVWYKQSSKKEGEPIHLCGPLLNVHVTLWYSDLCYLQLPLKSSIEGLIQHSFDKYVLSNR